MALELGAVLVGGALQLGAQRVDERVEPGVLAARDHDRAPPAAGQQPLRRAPARARLGQGLLREAHHRAVERLALLEHVHLPAPDHGHRARSDRHGGPVDRVVAATVADPDQLVVVVAVRLARGIAAEARVLESHDLRRAVVEAVEGQGRSHVA